MRPLGSETAGRLAGRGASKLDARAYWETSVFISESLLCFFEEIRLANLFSHQNLNGILLLALRVLFVYVYLLAFSLLSLRCVSYLDFLCLL